jgi:hypothetical protein
MSGLTVVFWGCVGGFFAELLNARALSERSPAEWNKTRERISFWVFAALFVAAGGLTALAHEQVTSINALLAINVGFAWPLALRRGIGGLPEGDYRNVS